jgi:hypothetical protein
MPNLPSRRIEDLLVQEERRRLRHPRRRRRRRADPAPRRGRFRHRDPTRSNPTKITPTFQTTDVQIGQQRAKGTLRGRFSGKTWQDFIAGICRQAFQTAPTTGALVNVTAAVGPITFTRAAGSYITDGFRVGHVVNWVGWATTGTANNNRYFLITTLTATVMTGVFLDGTAGGAKASGDSVTCTLAGKQTWIPQSGHTRDCSTSRSTSPT